MKKFNRKTKEEIEKLSESFVDSMVKCTCGHTQSILPSKSKSECTHCHRTIYNHTKARLRFLMLTDSNLLKQFENKGE